MVLSCSLLEPREVLVEIGVENGDHTRGLLDMVLVLFLAAVIFLLLCKTA